jgi:predicted hydrolase (HD superfamily)
VLFACDELAGFIVACTKVRPDGFASLQASSVKKKLKDKAFAANVSREDIRAGIAELAALTGQPPETFEPVHIQTCIDAIRADLPRMGL